MTMVVECSPDYQRVYAVYMKLCVGKHRWLRVDM